MPGRKTGARKAVGLDARLKKFVREGVELLGGCVIVRRSGGCWALRAGGA